VPSVSAKQRRFFGAELARKRAGKKTQTGLGEESLRDFARKPKGKKLPESKGPRAKNKPKAMPARTGRGSPLGFGRRAP
jgi:hypothetical protein